MARLPALGGDNGAWGNILNDYLLVEHNSDGTHKLTKTNVGLANVDNTSDANKPISTAVQTALNLKVNINSLVHNVKDYGAVGNGSTNDTAAIQNAINAGGITYFPAGVYMHSGFTLLSGSHLVGVASGGYVKNYSPSNQTPVPDTARTSLRLIAGSNADCITIPANTAHGAIEFMEIDGNKANQTSGNVGGIKLVDAANAEEAQWKFNQVYVHDARVYGLYIGVNRQGSSTHQSVYFACGTDDSTSGSGIVIAGSDTTVDSCFVGVSWGDNIKILSGVNRIINTEVFSNVLTATFAGSGIAIADDYGCTRNVISSCTVDRSAGHGLYIGSGSSGNIISGNVFHSNSQKTDGGSYHLTSKATGNVAVGNQFYANDAGANPNKPNYAVYILTATTLYGKNLNSVDAAAYNTAAINDPALLVVPNL